MLRKWFGRRQGMSLEAFRDEIGSRIQDSASVARVASEGEAGLHVWHSEQQEAPTTVDMTNMWKTYRAMLGDGLETDDLLREFTAAMAEDPDNITVEAGMLRPLIRHIEYMGRDAEIAQPLFENGENLPADHPGVWAAPFAGDLVWMAALEAPGTVHPVTRKHLEALGLTGPQALEQAIENERGIAREICMEDVNEAGLAAFYYAGSDEWMTPTLLAHDKLFQDMMAENGMERCWVAHPCRERVFFTDPRLEYAGDMMAEAVRLFITESHPQSRLVFEVVRGCDMVSPVMVVPENGAAYQLPDE